MEYMLVLQWPGRTLEEFDALTDLEEEIRDSLQGVAEVDGHDFGSGEMNIFVVTNAPEKTLKRILDAGLLAFGWSAGYRAAYRALKGGAKYTILWPPELKTFRVK